MSTLSLIFFNDTATTEIYTLSLHDALPISSFRRLAQQREALRQLGIVEIAHHLGERRRVGTRGGDRKSTRLNSSHSQISYAVFCLKKKNRLSQLITWQRVRTRQLTLWSPLP